MAVETRPAAFSLSGAELVEPLAQGDTDGLCGLYCLINAIRIVMAPYRELRREEVRALFTAGVGFLTRQGSLPEAVHSCIRERDWPKVATSIGVAAQDIIERPIVVEQAKLSRRVSSADTFRSLEQMIISGKAPCVFVRGKSRHYTVISGYTPLSFKLFDSFGYHRVLRRSCGTAGSASSLHRFHIQSIVAVSVL